MIALDFFCGAGGLTRGLIDAGVEVLAGFDRNEECRETYERNNPGVSFVRSNIGELNRRALTESTGIKSYRNVLFAGCAPCQAFSKRSMSKEYGRDARLLDEFGRLIEEASPGFVLMENVPGISKNRGRGVFWRFLKTLEVNGYFREYATLDAKHYGVPQNRTRLVLFASRRKHPSLPKPEYGTKLQPFKTVRDAISRFPAISAGERHPDVPNHVAASIKELTLKRLKNTPRDGGDRRSWPDHLVLDCHKNGYRGHTDAYGRMSWDSPAPTITGRCNGISNGRYGHPEQDRAISVREAAAIQSFPDDYVFFGPTSKSVATQVGNAVPVKMAEALGKQILRTHDACEKTS